MKERIAVIEGVRTPMDKAGGRLRDIPADDLAVPVLREVLLRCGIRPDEVSEVILGNVAQPAGSANIARVAALKAGIPVNVPAHTVHRNCASGMESITTAANQLLAGESAIVVAGGTESMSNIPFFFNKKMTDFYQRLGKARSFGAKLGIILSFRPSFLQPEIGVIQGLTDPVSGMIMGSTAEVLAREFSLTRREQDEYALESHMRAVRAAKEGVFQGEILPIPLPPDFRLVLESDGGPRENQTMEALAKLPPYFDRRNGTVTVGNSCPLTDGAAAVVLMTESKAHDRGIVPLGYLRDFAYASLEPERMGLGPVYATAKLLRKSGAKMSDFGVIELNEAFAAQVLACRNAFSSDSFAKKYLGLSEAVGELDLSITNRNGGAIALGHPVGMTGTRLVIHVLRELKRLGKETGLATLCVGGGQGASLLLEAV